MKFIVWKKWKDPIATVVQEAKGFDNYDDDDGPNVHTRQSRGNFGPCVIGPFGIIPIHEGNQPSSLYNFWIGYTNFEIDEANRIGIKLTTGVESLDVFTPYRFRIAIGKVFDARKVQKAVERQLSCKMRDRCNSVLERVQLALNENCKCHWSIQVDDNGETSIKFGETPRSVREQLVDDGRRTITSWG